MALRPGFTPLAVAANGPLPTDPPCDHRDPLVRCRNAVHAEMYVLTSLALRGIRMRPTGSPSLITCTTVGAVPDVVVMFGAVFVVEPAGAVDVVEEIVGLSRSWALNSRLRSFWARAVKTPVPQSW